MTEAEKAIANALTFECKKNSLGQAQSGDWKLSFTVAPMDVPMALLKAAMGTRYKAVIVEINDDETPVVQDKPSHKLSQQAAMLCGDMQFRAFLHYEHNAGIDGSSSPKVAEAIAAKVVRQICQVQSRSEFDTDPEAAARWRDLKAEYEGWKLV